MAPSATPSSPSSLATEESLVGTPFTLSLNTLEEIRETISSILTNLTVIKHIPDSLKPILTSVKADLEPLQSEGAHAGGAAGFRRGLGGGTGGRGGDHPTRQFNSQPATSHGYRGDSYGRDGRDNNDRGSGAASGGGSAWRRMPSAFSSSNSSAQHVPFGTSHRNQAPPFAQTRDTHSTQQTSGSTESQRSQQRPYVPGGKYQSRFKREGALQDKILNSIIGNKLNTFSPITYNDVRDFIYQILDSGETEFIRDFVEKVFDKATQEDIYCALFAKLLSEISSKYPMIRTEMEQYHKEFLRVFDNVQESKTAEYEVLVRQKQYRMGYGQFMSDLAGLNTLDPACLYAMVEKILENINTLTALEDRAKAVEEFIDCYTRMMKALKQKNPVFFKSIRETLSSKTIPQISPLIEKTAGPRPSLSSKARFGLMDLQDILSK